MVRRVEYRLLVLAFLLLLVHNVDEAFVHPEDGGVVSLVQTVVVAALVLTFYDRMTPRWRTVVLGFLGLVSTVLGTIGHLVPILSGDPAPLDWSGILFVAGGLLLVYVAVRN